MPDRPLPRRSSDLPEPHRAVVDKIRGNALVVAVQRLGGELRIDEAAMAQARGHYVTLAFADDLTPVFKVVKKP